MGITSYYRDPCALTPREKEIHDLFTQGHTRKQIAEILSLSVTFVTKALKSAQEKLETIEE